MSERNTIRARQLDDGTIVQELDDGTCRRLESRTDRDRLAAMTEEEIEANALADEDNPPITADELARMKPVPSSREIRQRLQMTQEQFSIRFHLPIGTVRDWEQGKKTPDSAAEPAGHLEEIDRTFGT